MIEVEYSSNVLPSSPPDNYAIRISDTDRPGYSVLTYGSEQRAQHIQNFPETVGRWIFESAWRGNDD